MAGAISGHLEEQVVTAARKVEDCLDAQIHALDAVDEDSLEKLRKQRVKTLKHISEKKAAWLRAGHGEYVEVYSDKEFFEQTRGEERVICHFYRENLACQVMHQRLHTLAREHIETKFIKVLAEKSPFLAERLRVWMLPTLAVIRNGKAIDYVVGLDELSETTKFSAEALEERLLKTDILLPVRGAARQKQRLTHGLARSRQADSDEDSDFG